MSDDWTPGEGWREVEQAEALRAPVATLCFDGLTVKRYWVRESPPPHEKGTVLRLQTGDFEQVAVFDGEYWRPLPQNIWLTLDDPQYPVQVLEVLAEPRSATAKAVLDRVRAERMNDVLLDVDIDDLAREFGLEP